jgi:hypothetical protein
MTGQSRAVQRVLAGLVGAAVAAGGLAVLAASPAAATTVFDEANFRLRWANISETQIDLGADITLTCAGGGVAVRDAVLTSITVNGHGHTITQTCPNNGVLAETSGLDFMTFQNVTITGGQAPVSGGGIGTSGPFALDASTVTLINSTVSGNSSQGDGGGIGLGAGNVTVTDSTISNNTATGAGGGVSTLGGIVSVTNSTISDNTSADGGGVFGGGAILVYATVVHNTAPLAANLAVSGLQSFGSVVALALGGGPNCAVAGSTSHGFNFSDDPNAITSCEFNDPSDSVGAANNPQLGGLASNGGPTFTRQPLTGSPLVDVIPVAHCSDDGASTITPLVDQRGVTRPQGTGCDIGAVEGSGTGPPPTTTTTTPNSTRNSTLIVITPKFTG